MKKIYNIELEGELDTLNIVDYDSKISKVIELIDTPSILILVFDKVTYINSTAIWNIADWYNKLEDMDSDLVLLWANDDILDTLNLVWLWDFINFYNDIEEFKLEFKND